MSTFQMLQFSMVPILAMALSFFANNTEFRSFCAFLHLSILPFAKVTNLSSLTNGLELIS